MGKRFEVLTGINYPGPAGAEVRRERGDMVDDLSEESAAVLLAAGALRPAKGMTIAITDAPTTGTASPAGGPYHAQDGKVYHTRPECSTGNNIEPATRLAGTGGLKECRECARLGREGKE